MAEMRGGCSRIEERRRIPLGGGMRRWLKCLADICRRGGVWKKDGGKWFGVQQAPSSLRQRWCVAHRQGGGLIWLASSAKASECYEDGNTAQGRAGTPGLSVSTFSWLSRLDGACRRRTNGTCGTDG